MRGKRNHGGGTAARVRRFHVFCFLKSYDHEIGIFPRFASGAFSSSGKRDPVASEHPRIGSVPYVSEAGRFQVGEKLVSNGFLLVDFLAIQLYFIPVLRTTSYGVVGRGETLENLTEMLKGVLEGCVLEIISHEEIYGYEITRRLKALGFSDVVDGTVYTILLRLEKNKLVDIERRPSDMGPSRKFFALNDAGRKELRRFWEKWEFVASTINGLKGKHI